MIKPLTDLPVHISDSTPLQKSIIKLETMQRTH